MASPTSPAPVDERRIEEEIRSFLGRLIQAIDRWATVLGLSMIAFIPLGIILAANFVFHWSFWQTVVNGFLIWLGLVIVMVVVSIRDESAKIRAAAAEFRRLYPEGSPKGEAALRILREMESPSKAEIKLLNVILGGTPDTPPVPIVRRRPGTTEDEIAEQLGDLAGGDVPPAIPSPPPRVLTPPVEPLPAPPPHSAPGATSAAAEKKGPQRFDFIPLEPFTPSDPGDSSAASGPAGKDGKR